MTLHSNDNPLDLTDSDLKTILILGTLVIIIPQMMNVMLQPTQRALAAQSYSGLVDSRVLICTPTLQWINLISDPPYTGWITASFHNDGWTSGGIHHDWSAFIGVNNPDELHELASGEDYHVNMAGGDRRIEYIFFKSNPGEEASVRVVGKY